MVALRRALDAAGLTDVEVGTVDRFQGRQAAVVFVSMTASSPHDVPRGLEFLLSVNRLNVALSRAQWATYLVHAPGLREIVATGPEGLMRVGGFLGVG